MSARVLLTASTVFFVMAVPEGMLQYVAQQIGARSAALTRYAERDQTRREHVVELQSRLGWKRFDGRSYRELGEWLIAPARATDRSLALLESLSEELRRRKLLAPPITVLERLARETRRKARIELYRALSGRLSETQHENLDGLLNSKPGSRHTVLGGLRESGTPATANNIVLRLERLHSLRALGIPLGWQQLVHPNRLKQLAREGLRVSQITCGNTSPSIVGLPWSPSF